MSKTVLITGCSEGGIGHALAVEFHTKGCNVIATARKLSKMSSLTALGMKTLKLDVSDLESIAQTAEEVKQLTSGKLDILVNNAGQAFSYSAALDLSIPEAKALFDVNLWGAIAMNQACTPLLLASQHGGVIVHTGSIAAYIPTPFASIYNASKAALHAYSDTLRIELAPLGIRVVACATGSVQTKVFDGQNKVLPEGSYYKKAEASLLKANEELQGPKAMGCEAYAKGVVAHCLKQSPGAYLWSGTNTTLVWLGNKLLGPTAFDGFLTKLMGLNLVSKPV